MRQKVASRIGMKRTRWRMPETLPPPADFLAQLAPRSELCLFDAYGFHSTMSKPRITIQ